MGHVSGNCGTFFNAANFNAFHSDIVLSLFGGVYQGYAGGNFGLFCDHRQVLDVHSQHTRLTGTLRLIMQSR